MIFFKKLLKPECRSFLSDAIHFLKIFLLTFSLFESILKSGYAVDYYVTMYRENICDPNSLVYRATRAYTDSSESESEFRIYIQPNVRQAAPYIIHLKINGQNIAIDIKKIVENIMQANFSKLIGRMSIVDSYAAANIVITSPILEFTQPSASIRLGSRGLHVPYFDYSRDVGLGRIFLGNEGIQAAIITNIYNNYYYNSPTSINIETVANLYFRYLLMHEFFHILGFANAISDNNLINPSSRLSIDQIAVKVFLAAQSLCPPIMTRTFDQYLSEFEKWYGAKLTNPEHIQPNAQELTAYAQVNFIMSSP